MSRFVCEYVHGGTDAIEWHFMHKAWIQAGKEEISLLLSTLFNAKAYDKGKRISCVYVMRYIFSMDYDKEIFCEIINGWMNEQKDAWMEHYA